MSVHVKDRLSAYMDRELPEAERRAVEGHLGECDACGRHLEALAAVDRLARTLTLSAPTGYFETLPARVRARIAPRTRKARALPVWSWAVAAALFVAVVAPLVLKHGSGPSLAERAMPAPPAARARETPAADQPESPSATGPIKVQSASPAVRALEKSAPPGAPPPTATRDARAAADSSAQDALARQATAPLNPVDAAVPTPLPGAAPPTGGSAKRAKSENFAPAPESLEGAAGHILVEPAEEKDAAEIPPAAEAPAPARATRPDGHRAAPATAGESRREKATNPAAEFRALASRSARDVTEARRLREDWRAFVLHYPLAHEADEGRVRMIEAGAQAWRFSNDPADRILLRDDAASYLRRDDAAQGDRVRTLLATIGS